ncbi:MAG: N-acyl homoserine lactonase family protein [Deltaproteobacteria bacterium]|nr:N-acyl homoserine lactonase family protein [Deltaproteobacteria bacterium]
MSKWRIQPLVFGTIEVKKDQLTTGLDVGLPLTVPYLGFYLTDGTAHVLVDNGINSKYIVDGKAWAGSPAVGGRDFVIKALVDLRIEPDQIETVIYTHLHNDHAGNCDLFPDAAHVFQDSEWKELLDPLPSMRIRGDYDQSLIPELNQLRCIKVVGDTELFDGIRLTQTPGHTAGSQCLLVDTVDGFYTLAGDTVHVLPIAFPEMDHMILMDGSVLPITAAPKNWGPAVPSCLVYDHYAWFRSIYRIKSTLKGPQFLLPGHEPSLVGKIFG